MSMTRWAPFVRALRHGVGPAVAVPAGALRGARRAWLPGGALQLETRVEIPWIRLLKLEHDNSLISSFAFNINWCPYIEEGIEFLGLQDDEEEEEDLDSVEGGQVRGELGSVDNIIRLLGRMGDDDEYISQDEEDDEELEELEAMLRLHGAEGAGGAVGAAGAWGGGGMDVSMKGLHVAQDVDGGWRWLEVRPAMLNPKPSLHAHNAPYTFTFSFLLLLHVVCLYVLHLRPGIIWLFAHSVTVTTRHLLLDIRPGPGIICSCTSARSSHPA